MTSLTPQVGVPRKKTVEFEHSTITYDYTRKLLTLSTDDGSLILNKVQLAEFCAGLKSVGLPVGEPPQDVQYR